jgi:hypothetical protein
MDIPRDRPMKSKKQRAAVKISEAMVTAAVEELHESGLLEYESVGDRLAVRRMLEKALSVGTGAPKSSSIAKRAK